MPKRGLVILLPLRVRPTEADFPDLEITMPELSLPLPPEDTTGGTGTTPPPTTTPPPPTPTPPPPTGVVVANPPIGLTAWDQDAAKLIAYHIAYLLNVPPPNYETVIVFAVQAHHEDAGGNTAISQGALYNNPLNLTDANGTIVWPGQTGRYLGAFAKFDSLEAGANACALNYVNGRAYAAVIDAFRANDYLRMAQAIQESPWDADHYGGNLVNEVRAALGI